MIWPPFGSVGPARPWLGVPASRYTAKQSVRLETVIINPRRFSPVEPPRRIERRIRMISSRMLRKGELTETDYRDVRGLPPLPPPAADTLAPEPDGEPPAADTAATGG